MTVCQVTDTREDDNDSSNTLQDFCGNKDDKNLRQGAGCQTWGLANTLQFYSGQFLDNNLHGIGQYTFKCNDKVSYYSGYFYNNKLEGYGQIIYEDESYYEGLFKENIRFGPGIWTRKNKTQDVGLWFHKSLIRLCVIVEPDWVPHLGRTPTDKARLLKYRNLVNIKDEKPDVAKEILQKLGASEELLAKSDEIYNSEVRNPNSLFFNILKYDRAIYGEDRYTIEVEINENEDEESRSLDGEQSMEGDISDNQPKCRCTMPENDRFTQLAVKLYEVDEKLNKIQEQKYVITKQLEKCKCCCEKFTELLQWKYDSTAPLNQSGILDYSGYGYSSLGSSELCKDLGQAPGPLTQDFLRDPSASDQTSDLSSFYSPITGPTLENFHLTDNVLARRASETGTSLNDTLTTYAFLLETLKDQDSGDDALSSYAFTNDVLGNTVSLKYASAVDLPPDNVSIIKPYLQNPECCNIQETESKLYTRETPENYILENDVFSDKTNPVSIYQEDTNNVPPEKNPEINVPGSGAPITTLAHQPNLEFLNGIPANVDAVLIQNYVNAVDSFPSENIYETTTNIEKYLQNQAAPEGEVFCSCDFNMIGNVKELLQHKEKLCKEETSLLIMKHLLKKGLDQEFEKSTQTKPLRTERISISELVAWNNEEINKDILKHTFLNRCTENMVTFKVKELLCGKRSNCEPPGEYENACKNFLSCCSNGDAFNSHDLLKKHCIHPDLCDANGNSGIIFATARDKLQIVRTLVNFGGNINVFNDEGLTPLTLAICRYLCLVYDFSDWTTALLQPSDLTNDEEITYNTWNINRSLMSVASDSPSVTCNKYESVIKLSALVKDSICSIVESHTKSIKSHVEAVKSKLCMKDSNTQTDFQKRFTNNEDSKQNSAYIFDTSFVQMTRTRKKGKKAKGVRINETAKMRHKKQKNKNKKANEEENTSRQSVTNLMKEKQEQKQTVYMTILTLLHYGANPNIGEVPLPPLFLSVFSKIPELVKVLLERGADPNIYYDDMTPLHMVCSLPRSKEKVEISKHLIHFKADPNLKTTSLHWASQNSKILGKQIAESDNNGKNALHILCIREDFPLDIEDHQCEIAKSLFEASCNTSETFLGHTPLSLAVLKGNAKMITFLLENKYVNPYQPLGNDMGNALSLFILKRFSGALPFDVFKSTIDLLLGFNVNPFNHIYDCRNLIEFVDKQNESQKKKGSKKGKRKGKKNKKDSKSKSSKGSKKNKQNSKQSKKSSKSSKRSKGKSTRSKKSSKSSKKASKDNIGKYYYDASRQFLLRHIKGTILEYIYTFFEEDIEDESLKQSFAKFFTKEEAVTVMKMLFNFSILQPERLNMDTCKKLLNYIEEYGIKLKRPKKSKSKSRKKKKKRGSRKTNKKKNKKRETSKKSNKKTGSKSGKSTSSKSGKSTSSKSSKSTTSKSVKTSETSSLTDSEKLLPPKVLTEIDFQKIKKEKTKYSWPAPEYDRNNDKYKVCFNCLKKPEGKLLIPCPGCCLIYFCSEECNKKNMKFPCGHSCKIHFYKEEKAKIDNKMAQGDYNFEADTKLERILAQIRENKEQRGRKTKWEEQLAELEREIERCINVKKLKVLRQQLELLKKDKNYVIDRSSMFHIFYDAVFEAHKKRRYTHFCRIDTKAAFEEHLRKTETLPPSIKMESEVSDVRTFATKESQGYNTTDQSISKEMGKTIEPDEDSKEPYRKQLTKKKRDENSAKQETANNVAPQKRTIQLKIKSRKQKIRKITKSSENITGKIVKPMGVKNKHVASSQIKLTTKTSKTPDQFEKKANKTRKHERKPSLLSKETFSSMEESSQRQYKITSKDLPEKSIQNTRTPTTSPQRSHGSRRKETSYPVNDPDARQTPLGEVYKRLSQPRSKSIGEDTIKKERVSKRAEYFTKLIAHYFPEFDSVSASMPFACYDNGQIYYTFNSSDNNCATYSRM